eukprot:scaffold19940_cov124-Isochrysis_galbana.AAC.4
MPRAPASSTAALCSIGQTVAKPAGKLAGISVGTHIMRKQPGTRMVGSAGRAGRDSARAKADDASMASMCRGGPERAA